METDLASPFACSPSDLHPMDYVSPNFKVIKPDACFPSMTLGNFEYASSTSHQICRWTHLTVYSNIKNPLFRKNITHAWYVDPTWPECGFLTRDEAHILYNNALLFRGKQALEIGTHVGWSTVHLALAGVMLDAVEPMLKHDIRLLMAIIQSLRAAGVNNRVNLVPGFSPGEVEKLATQSGKRWSLMFIDGNHNDDWPLKDAKVCEKYAAEDAMILFHDLAFPDVAAGFRYLHERGWKTKIYHTQQIMGAAYRGNITPAEHIVRTQVSFLASDCSRAYFFHVHQPDPRFEWSLPEHLNWWTAQNDHN